MSERQHALSAVERVRANAVESARAQLSERVLTFEQAERVLRDCQAAHACAAHGLSAALRAPAALQTPQDLVWAERQVRALRLDLETARLRFLRAQAQFEHERARVAEARTALRELELDRRAIANVVERGRSDAALVRSRRQEEENDEAFRTRKG